MSKDFLSPKNDYIFKLLFADERTRLLYESRQKKEWDDRARIEHAKKEGIKEGEEKGRKESAKNLLSMGLTIEQIEKATGLTVDEIKALL
jgi:predicted transposase/invertase (TIGR01784 family)